MKTSGSVTSCCLALFFALTSVSAVQRLNSFSHLKKINFGQSVPKHILVLLHWFANTVDIDNNNIIWLNFDPNSGDYGSHHYGNFEELLDLLPLGNVRYRYYTIGNLYQETSMPLPPYVVRPRTEYVGRNRGRIIIRVREQNTGLQAVQRIDHVYITQHYDISENQGTPYDPAHTYRITPNLLTQIREFSLGQNQQQLLQLRNLYGSNADYLQIRNTWGDLACLGLLLFIVIQEKSSSNQYNNRPENNSRHGNRRNYWNEDASRSERNDRRGLHNQGDFVVDFNNDEDQEASGTTVIREPGSDNTSWAHRSFCCICCICCVASLCVISLCTILVVLYKRMSNTYFIPSEIAV